MKIAEPHTMKWSLAIWLVAAASLVNAQESPKITALIEKEAVAVGEPFVFELQIEHVDEADVPDLSLLSDDFTVEFAGSRRNNSANISIINGRTTRVISRQYIIDFRLTAKRTGRIEIPAISVTAEGKTLTTQPLVVVASPPEPVKGFKLTTTLSKTTCYVGEPIAMTTTFYVGSRVSGPTFTMPVLSAPEFFCEPLILQQPNTEHFQLTIDGKTIYAEPGNARLDGNDISTVSFEHVLVPKSAGELTIPAATVSGQIAAGRRRSSMSFFGAVDDLKAMVVQSEPVTLSVKPVPEEGKPDNFSGLIGAFTMSTSASPTEVNVGDPITLTIAVEGSFYLRHFELPSLQRQPALAEQFRIPDEMAPGQAENNRKIFTQTIRAQSPDVVEIPPIELAYFDTATGRYELARSKPIPLKVRAAQVVTASDAEGFRPQSETVEHVAINDGIAHNFTEPDALDPQHFGPDVWMRSLSSWLLLLMPPLAWSVLAGARFLRRLGGLRPKARARKLARSQLTIALSAEGLDAGKLLQALRAYLAAKLDLRAGALTLRDVEQPLRAQGAKEDTLRLLKGIFDECDACHYAGGGGGTTSAGIAEKIAACADALEKEIG